MRIASLTALVVGVWLALAAPARASEIGIVVTGDSWMQPQLAAQIASWLTQHGHTLVASPLTPDAITTLDDCFATGDPACARAVIDRRSRALSVIYARIDARSSGGDAPDLTLTAYWLTKGHDATTERKLCQRCTDQSLRALADDILKKLVGGSDLGRVIFKSAPPGARISIDGTPIGVTPLDWDLPPGKHAIQMDKAGRKPGTRDISVVSNHSELVVMTLSPDERDERPLPRAPLTMLIGGGAAVITGAALIALSPDPDPQHRYYYRTWPAGIAVAAAGTAVAAAGAYWLWFRAPRTSAPVAAVTRDAAYVGWAGWF